MTGIRFQAWAMRGNVDAYQSFLLAPLFVLLLVGIAKSRGQENLIPQAALGAALLCVWNICVQTGGALVSTERRYGTFELTVASPASFVVVILGRVTTVAAVALLALPEVWMATIILFGTVVTVHHPLLFLPTLALTAFGMASVSVLVSALFILGRDALQFQIVFTYPFFILGGIIVPVERLPNWLEPVSHLLFLSWASDLLRASLAAGAPDSPGEELLGLTVSSAVTFAVGLTLLHWLVVRARARGTLGLA